MARKPKPPKGDKPKSWSMLDDVEYDDEEDGARPIPDDDGNVVLRRSAEQGGRKHVKAQDKRKPGRRR
jgi:hypothetical protein